MGGKLDIDSLIEKNSKADRETVEETIRIFEQICQWGKKGYRLRIPYTSSSPVQEQSGNEDTRQVVLNSSRK